MDIMHNYFISKKAQIFWGKWIGRGILLTSVFYGTYFADTGKFWPSDIKAEWKRQEIERVEYNRINNFF